MKSHQQRHWPTLLTVDLQPPRRSQRDRAHMVAAGERVSNSREHLQRAMYTRVRWIKTLQNLRETATLETRCGVGTCRLSYSDNSATRPSPGANDLRRQTQQNYVQREISQRSRFCPSCSTAVLKAFGAQASRDLSPKSWNHVYKHTNGTNIPQQFNSHRKPDSHGLGQRQRMEYKKDAHISQCSPAEATNHGYISGDSITAACLP